MEKPLCYKDIFYLQNYPNIEHTRSKATDFKNIKIRQEIKKLKKYPPHTAVLGIGANIPNKPKIFKNLNNLFSRLSAHPKIRQIKTSFVFQNKAFGFLAQNDFYNTIIIIKTSLNFSDLRGYIFYLERVFKRDRKRKFKNAPRTLDIDLIFYNNFNFSTTSFSLPHKEWQNRASVTKPLGWLLCANKNIMMV